jgi:hypothetical protein
MGSRSRGAEPARFEAVRQRFERWRRSRQGRARIPERLWTSAVQLAATYGLCRTARTLRLDYYALKKRVGSADLNDLPAGCTPKRKTPARSTSTARKSAQNPAMAFVELTPVERLASPECVVELEHPRGAKMRICLTGRESLEVVTAVSRAFFGIGS